MADFYLTTHNPNLTVTLSEVKDLPCPVVDGVDSEFERAVVNAIAELTPSGQILLQRAGGNRSDAAMVVTVPATEKEREAVEKGLLRGLLNHCKALPTHDDQRTGSARTELTKLLTEHLPWWQRVFIRKLIKRVDG